MFLYCCILYLQNNLREREQDDRKLFNWCRYYGTCATKYVADFGKYGKVIMKVKNGNYNMDFYLKNIVDDFFGNIKEEGDEPSESTAGFDYHLHSGQAYGIGAKPDGTKEFCGPSYTSGHYDPDLGCGGASTARPALCVDDNGDEVPKDGYPFAEGVIAGGSGGFEVGDLSGSNGKLDIINKKVTGSVHGSCPECDADYLDPNTSDKQGAFDTWYSIVFHDGATGARLLCANFVKY